LGIYTPIIFFNTEKSRVGQRKAEIMAIKRSCQFVPCSSCLGSEHIVKFFQHREKQSLAEKSRDHGNQAILSVCALLI
jgi:hypothetical protein